MEVPIKRVNRKYTKIKLLQTTKKEGEGCAWLGVCCQHSEDHKGGYGERIQKKEPLVRDKQEKSKIVWDRDEGNSDSKNKIINVSVSVDGNTIAPVAWHKKWCHKPALCVVDDVADRSRDEREFCGSSPSLLSVSFSCAWEQARRTRAWCEARWSRSCLHVNFSEFCG